MYHPPSSYHINFNQVSFENRVLQILTIDKNLRDLILLDSASTVHLFMNVLLLCNIAQANIPLYLNTNNGINVTTKQRIFDDLDI